MKLRTRVLWGAGVAVLWAALFLAWPREPQKAVRVTLKSGLSTQIREAVESTGAQVIGVLPPQELSVAATKDQLEKLRALPEVAEAKPTPPTEKLQRGLPTSTEDSVFLTIVPTTSAAIKALKKRVAELGGTVEELVGAGELPRLRVHLAGTQILALAEEGEVRWIERYQLPRFLNDVAVGPDLMNVKTTWNVHGLTGRGQYITTSDTGIDTGSTSTMHADLKDNVVGFSRANRWDCYSYDSTGHGTHTAGSIIGTGTNSNGRIRGVAYEAKLWAWFCAGKGGYEGYVLAPSTVSSLYRPSGLTAGTAYIHSASWGGEEGVYNSNSQAIDQYLWQHPDFLPVYSAGNSGTKTNTITCQAGAKNVLAVGASENYRPTKSGYSAKYPNRICSFSSRGPLPDGRIKPDVVAPGSWILSTASTRGSNDYWSVSTEDPTYAYCGGTSMSCPLTAGTMALVRQWLVERRGFSSTVPTAALMKAVITGGATELKGTLNSNVSALAPNKDEGWGRVNLTDTLYPTNGTAVTLCDRIPFSSGSAWSTNVVTTGEGPLTVQLVWIDYPADPSASHTLVNDLDLEVKNVTTGETWAPNDHTNNLEGVRIDSVPAGTYQVSVKGSSVTYDSTQGGAAALYIKGVYPPVEKDIAVPVKVTIAHGSSHYGEATPDYGEYEFASNQTMTFTADAYAILSTNGTAHTRYPLLGESSQTIVLTNTTTITWNWDDLHPDYRYLATLRLYGYADSGYSWFRGYYPATERYYDYPYSLKDAWVATNTTFTLHLPEDLAYDPFERTSGFHSTDDFATYAGPSNWTYRFSQAFYSRIVDGSGQYLYSSEGPQMRSVEITADEGFEVTLDYYEENDCLTKVPTMTATLETWAPTWWTLRYLGSRYLSSASVTGVEETDDPDADGFTNEDEYHIDTDPLDAKSLLALDEVSATNVEWTAGAEVPQVLETRSSLNLSAPWTILYTNQTGNTKMNYALPFQANGNFYRIRVPKEMQR